MKSKKSRNTRRPHDPEIMDDDSTTDDDEVDCQDHRKIFMIRNGNGNSIELSNNDSKAGSENSSDVEQQEKLRLEALEEKRIIKGYFSLKRENDMDMRDIIKLFAMHNKEIIEEEIEFTAITSAFQDIVDIYRRYGAFRHGQKLFHMSKNMVKAETVMSSKNLIEFKYSNVMYNIPDVPEDIDQLSLLSKFIMCETKMDPLQLQCKGMCSPSAKQITTFCIKYYQIGIPITIKT